MRLFLAGLMLLVCPFVFAQSEEDSWHWRARGELRDNYRYSEDERFQLAFPFPPEFLPPGQRFGFEATPDAGGHFELSVAAIQLDLGYGNLLGARARVHFEDKYRRNPTSSDKQIDAEELWVRLGQMPEMLARPDGTSFFVLAGKSPKMERQPTRLLESYGLAATAFNRFEDVQLMGGGSVGRNFYWRAVLSSGNPVFFRDANALAGDNGTPELRLPFPDPAIKSGFPILYNAEAEGLFFDTDTMQFGQGLGYRWQSEDQTRGFDFVAFHYERDLAEQRNLTGTFYGGDLDLLDGVAGFSLPIKNDRKEEWGARLYTEWNGFAGTAQFTKQNIAGLWREGWEGEAGYRFETSIGPLRYIQPAARLSGITNRFRGPAEYPAPSVWWQWSKIDAGVRVGLSRGVDMTVETTWHNVGAPKKLNLRETLVTFRWRAG